LSDPIAPGSNDRSGSGNVAGRHGVLF
jgi:hypothetical protein